MRWRLSVFLCVYMHVHVYVCTSVCVCKLKSFTSCEWLYMCSLTCKLQYTDSLSVKGNMCVFVMLCVCVCVPYVCVHFVTLYYGMDGNVSKTPAMNVRKYSLSLRAHPFPCAKSKPHLNGYSLPLSV